MLVQLGNDDVGRRFIDYFRDSNVGVKYAKLLEGVGTGEAYILSLRNGDNSIVIVGGSNTTYDPNMTELDPVWRDAIQTSEILVLQREIPEFVNVIAARVAKEAGTLVILDVGGRDEPLSDELLNYLDIISPNETELERVIHTKITSPENLDSEIITFLGKYPSIKVLLKQGENGSSLYYLDESSQP